MSNFKENVGTQNVVTKWSKAMDSSNHGCSDFMESSFTVSLCKKKMETYNKDDNTPSILMGDMFLFLLL